MQAIPETMAAMVLVGHGGPEVLEYQTQVAVPVAAKGEVLVQVRAAGVNNTDVNTRLAWYAKSDDDGGWNGEALKFPRIQGADVCGVIVAVGEGVSDSRIGERVLIEPCIREVAGETLESPWYFGSECNGGFAQYTKVASRHAVAIHSELSDIELASFPCSYSTAENMLTRAQVKAGDLVLVTGASGGVGSATVQLAKARGAEVIAVTSDAKAQQLLALGAQRTLDRNAEQLESLGHNAVDVVIDLVAGDKWPLLLDVLKPGGRYAVAGAIGGYSVQLDVRTLYLKDLSFFGCTVLNPEVFTNLVSRIERGEIQPLVAQTFELKDMLAAQEAFVAKNHTGKIVLTVPQG